MKLALLLLVLPFSCLSALTEDSACGGTYRGFQYTITSPNYPANYPARTECIYRLEGEATHKCEQQFHLQFLDFNVKASEDCRGDYLQVGDENLYCGNTAGLRKFNGRNNTLIVRFHSDDRDTAKGFKILVSALPCSLKLSPLRDPSLNLDVAKAERSNAKARGIGSTEYRRGVRGGFETELNNTLTLGPNLSTNDVSSSIRGDQVGSTTAASDNNSIVNGNSYAPTGNPRITSYLFLPPKETNANVTLHYKLGPSPISDKSSERAATYPPSDLLPPRVHSISNFDEFNLKKIGLPARNYGEASLGLADYDLSLTGNCDKSGQLLQPSQGSSDRINYDSLQSAGYGSSQNLVYDPKYGVFVQSNNYPGSGYYPPNSGYPTGNYPTGNYPTGYPGEIGSVSGGFLPGYPTGGYEPNDPGLNPSIGAPAGFVGSECCRVPSARRFSVVSPGFPGGIASNNQLSCRYTIVKSSPDVCRLRLNFRFFNFGVDDPYCSLGYVDVDGQRFCGCRTGQSLQLLFTDYLVKTISIFSPGNPRGRLNGFLIDVIQEPCNTQGSYPGFYPPSYPGAGYLRRRSANASDIVPSPVDPNPLIRNKRDLGYSYQQPNVPFFDKDVQLIPTVDKAQTHSRFFTGNCQSRLLFDWAIAAKEAFFKNARCTTVYGNPGFSARQTRSYSSADEQQSSCQEINENQGEIKSPLYPNVYPANVKKCYRFNRAPNFCKLEVYVRDFDLESSQGCASDYLSFSVDHEKYCGRSLNDFTTVFDLTLTNSLQIDFVSDDHGTGRGFDIGFSQLPCEPSLSL